MDILPILGGVCILALVAALIIFIIRIPIIVAKSRGVGGSELSTITLLSWCSLLIGVTWIVALVLALVWQPKQWIDKGSSSDVSSADVVDTLAKLGELRDKKIITRDEFDAEKKKVLSRLS